MAFYRCGSSGGTAPTAVGNFNFSTTAKVSVDTGFKPKYLCMRIATSETAVNIAYIYDERFSTTNFLRTSTGQTLASVPLGSTTDSRIYSIDSNGFTMNKGTASQLGSYFAIG